MRNLSRHAGPNRMMFLLLIPCLLLSALRAKAEETALPEGKRPGVTLQVEMDLVSSYIWRGVYEAGPSLQPGLTLGIGNFTIAAWGSVDFTSSSYKEADLMLSYRLKNITFHLKDLYDEGSASDRNPQISRNYFHFGADSPHRIEAGIEWQVSRKVPITLSWYTILFGARDVDTRGRRCYSSYVEVAYPFTVKTIDLKTGVGAAPWKTAGEGGAKGFAVKNVFINAGKLWAVKSMGSFRIGLFTHLSWCPLKEDMKLRRRHFAADVTAKNNREALPSMTEGLLCFVQLHLRTFPLRTRPAKKRAYCITSTQFTAKTDFIVP